MKKAWALIFLIAAAALPSAAQSNQLLDEILEAPAVTYGQAAYLVLTAVQKLPESSTPAEAAEALAGAGWRLKVRPADEPITLGDYSFLLMQAFELSGGMFYSLFPGPRYATRELAYRRLIPGKAYPGKAVTGEEAVRLLGAVMELKGAGS